MRRLLAFATCLPVVLVILLPVLSPVHPQNPDYGGYRPQYPPIGAYDTVGGRGGAIYFVDTLEWNMDPARGCTDTCGGLATTAVCDTVSCYHGSLGSCLAASGARSRRRSPAAPHQVEQRHADGHAVRYLLFDRRRGAVG